MPTLRQLKLFEAVARLRGYTRAAKELGVTQPAVSIQVKQLEGEIGLPLFEKAGKQLFLSAAGDELLRASEDVLNRLRNLERGIAELKGEIKGTLDIAVTSTANYFMPHLLGAFQARHRGVTSRLAVGNLQWMIERLSSRKDDLVVMSHVPDLPGVEARPFLEDRLVVVAPADHPLVGEPKIPISRLAHEPFVLRELGSSSRMVVEQVFRDLGVPFRVSMEMGSAEAVKQGVLAGLGLSILSSFSVAGELAAGRLTALDVNGFPLHHHWKLVTARDKHPSLLAKTFSSFVMSDDGKRIAEAVRPRIEVSAVAPLPRAV